MDKKNSSSWFVGIRRKFENAWVPEFKSSRNQLFVSHEKLPPRLQMKGITVAARVVGHEIRNFTKKTIGKDLAQIKESRTRQQFLSKFSELRIAVTNNDAKYNLLTLACNHSTNFTLSLSPDGEYVDRDTEFEKNLLRKFISKYYQNCLEQEKGKDSKVPKLRVSKRKIDEVHDVDNQSSCRCNSQLLDEKRSRSSFLTCWEHKGIKEEKLDRYYAENISHFIKKEKRFELNIEEDHENWKEFMRNDQCVVFRKKLKSGLYEYRVQATFYDISANHLFKTQLDGEYRKKWDEYVIDLRVLETHQKTSSDLVHWITKCPYPFATREYIYLRRKKIDQNNKALILYQEATNEVDVPVEKDIHRVDTYVSKMIIKPHLNDFDQIGCDFLLTYYDDPKMNLPQRLLDIAASKGIGDSVSRMHDAALRLKQKAEQN